MITWHPARIAVHAARCADLDYVQLFTGEHLASVGVGADLISFCELVCFFGDNIGHGHEFCIGEALERFRVQWTDNSTTDDTKT
jgi:hypothetical protein